MMANALSDEIMDGIAVRLLGAFECNVTRDDHAIVAVNGVPIDLAIRLGILHLGGNRVIGDDAAQSVFDYVSERQSGEWLDADTLARIALVAPIWTDGTESAVRRLSHKISLSLRDRHLDARDCGALAHVLSLVTDR